MIFRPSKTSSLLMFMPEQNSQCLGSSHFSHSWKQPRRFFPHQQDARRSQAQPQKQIGLRTVRSGTRSALGLVGREGQQNHLFKRNYSVWYSATLGSTHVINRGLRFTWPSFILRQWSSSWPMSRRRLHIRLRRRHRAGPSIPPNHIRRRTHFGNRAAHTS